MRNEVLLKTFWYGPRENASVSMSTPYMISENGGRPTNCSLVPYILIHNFGGVLNLLPNFLVFHNISL